MDQKSVFQPAPCVPGQCVHLAVCSRRLVQLPVDARSRAQEMPSDAHPTVGSVPPPANGEVQHASAGANPKRVQVWTPPLNIEVFNVISDPVRYDPAPRSRAGPASKWGLGEGKESHYATKVHYWWLCMCSDCKVLRQERGTPVRDAPSGKPGRRPRVKKLEYRVKGYPGEGPTVRAPPRRGTRGGKPPRNVNCFTCGLEGHRANKCPAVAAVPAAAAADEVDERKVPAIDPAVAVAAKAAAEAKQAEDLARARAEEANAREQKKLDKRRNVRADVKSKVGLAVLAGKDMTRPDDVRTVLIAAQHKVRGSAICEDDGVDDIALAANQAAAGIARGLVERERFLTNLVQRNEQWSYRVALRTIALGYTAMSEADLAGVLKDKGIADRVKYLATLKPESVFRGGWYGRQRANVRHDVALALPRFPPNVLAIVDEYEGGREVFSLGSRWFRFFLSAGAVVGMAWVEEAGKRWYASLLRRLIVHVAALKGIEVAKRPSLSQAIGNFSSIFTASLLATLESNATREGWMARLWRLLCHNLYQRYAWAAALLHPLWNVLVYGRVHLMLPETLFNQPAAAPPSSKQQCLVTALTQVNVCSVEAGTPPAAMCASSRVKKYEHHCEPGFGGKRWGGVKGWVASLPRVCSCSELNAYQHRVGKDIPAEAQSRRATVDKGWLEAAKPGGALDVVRSLVPRVRTPMPKEAYYAKIGARKALIYQRAEQEAEGQPPAKDVKGHVKIEAYVHREGEWNGKPYRFVQALDPWYSNLCGRFVIGLTKKAKYGLAPRRAYARAGEITRAAFTERRHIMNVCGETAEGVGRLFTRCVSLFDALGKPWRVFGSDQSKFDLHIRGKAWFVLDKYYDGKIPAVVRRALRRPATYKGYGKWISYVMDAMMQSGIPDTSHGDGIFSTIMMYHLYGPGNEWLALINGDDTLIFMTEELFERLGARAGISKAYDQVFGMEAAVETYDSVQDAKFCSQFLMRADEQWMLVPCMGKQLARILTDTVDRPHAEGMAWLASIANVLVTWGHCNIILGTLGARLLELTKGVAPLPLQINEWKNNTDGTVRASFAQQLVFFDHRYGISAADVESACNYLLTYCLGDMDHYVLELIVEKDC